MNELLPIGVSALLSVFSFLFVAWVRGQMKEQLLEVELRFNKEFVAKVDLERHMESVHQELAQITKQLMDLQRMFDRRMGENK